MGQFARLLPDDDWDVTVITGIATSRDSLDKRSESDIASRARIVRTHSPSSTVIKRGHAAPRHGVPALLRKLIRTAVVSVMFPDRDVLWLPGAVKAARNAVKAEKHDVVLATYGPATNLLVGYAVASSMRLPLVVDFRDLWSTLPMPVFPTPLHRSAAHAIERAIVRKASRLTAVSPAMANDLAVEHGIDPEHAISITNGFDPADATRVRDDRTQATRPFLLVYTGTVHIHYNMDPLWRALRMLADAGKITPDTFRIEFVGNLAISDVERHGLTELVTVRPFVAHAEVFDALARADALLVVETPGYYATNGYAAKVFDYVLTGKPVVGLVERGGNTHDLLRRAGVGYCVEPGDTAGLVNTLLEVLPLQGAAPRAVSVDEEPFRDFNREHLVRRLAGVLNDVVETEPQGRW